VIVNIKIHYFMHNFKNKKNILYLIKQNMREFKGFLVVFIYEVNK